MKEVILLAIFSFFGWQDLKRKAVLKKHLMVAAAVSVLVCSMFPTLTLLDTVSGVSVGVGIWLLSILSKESIGAGDGIMLMISGIFLGGTENMTLLFLALLYAALYSLIKILQKKIEKKQELPFIPFLTVSYLTMIIL